MIRALRELRPIPARGRSALARPSGARRAAFALGLLAVMLEFAISPNLMALAGIDYDTAGGNPVFKLHIATYITVIAAFIALFLEQPPGSALVRLFRATPALGLFLVLITLCTAYSIVSVGFSGAAVYVESYISAGLLAVALEGGTDRQRRWLAGLFMAFCVLNVFISVGESLTQTHMIPMRISDFEINEGVDDFRGAALYSHPLTGATITAMAVFLLLRMRVGAILSAVLFTILLIGLLSFGGRMALATTVVLLLVAAIATLMRGLVTRRLSGGFIAAIIGGALLLPPLLAAVIMGTTIGDRIMTHLYYDDSMAVRNVQWLVLNYLDPRDVLFGVTPDRMTVLKYQIGLAGETTDIENFWLLMFLNLGIIGFMVFLVAFGLFLLHLGRRVRSPVGWMLLIATIAIDSTSNSLGRKSIDLFMLAACMIAMTGYQRIRQAETAPAPVAAPARRSFRHYGPLRVTPSGVRPFALSRLLAPRSSIAPLAGTKP